MMKTRKYIAVIFAAMDREFPGVTMIFFWKNIPTRFTRLKMLSRPWIR